ncbi:MAG: hypothetical protein U1F36_09925 [Planctomycetota bacterium]
MSDLQFSLFFVAIIVGYLLVHARMVRLESWLARLGRLEALEQKLDKMQATLERIAADVGAEQHPVQPVSAEDPTAVRDALARVERVLRDGFAQLQSAATPIVVASATPQASVADASAPERIRAVVETRLLELGYRDLRILGDLSEARLEERTEVRVEATRQHMPMKGIVAVRNASVVDIALQSAAKSFP